MTIRFEPATPDVPWAITGLRILLVDDAPDTLEAFGTLLRSEGATVELADSARQAWALMATHEFDLLLSDIGMPDIDGHELLGSVRRAPRTAALPAIALSGFVRPADVQRALDSGFDAFIGKPIDLDMLMHTIGTVMARRKLDAAG